MCLRINREESIIAGPSSGLALVGALKIIQDQPDAVVVIMFADNAFKYASSFQTHFPEMFKDITGSKSNPNNKKKDLLLCHAIGEEHRAWIKDVLYPLEVERLGILEGGEAW